MTKIEIYLDTNMIHDFFVNQASFVSGDKDILRKLMENDVYNNVMTYTELREFVEKGDN